MTTDRGYPWLKIYPTLLDDPKYIRLSDGAKARYTEFYLIAGKADAGGLLTIGDDIATLEDLSIVLRLPDALIMPQIKELVKSGLIVEENGGYLIKRFQEEQGPSQNEKREDWKKRQDKRREKFKNQEQEENQEQEKDKDKEEDKEVTRVSRVTTTTTLPEIAKEPEPSLYLLAMALSEVSGLSFEANKARIFREAKLLSKDPNATPERIRADYGAGGLWYSCDWRGQKGQAPTLEQVRSTFGTFKLPKKLKTVGDVVPEQTEEQVRSIAQQLFEFNKAKEAEEARKAWIHDPQLKEEIENCPIMSY